MSLVRIVLLPGSDLRKVQSVNFFPTIRELLVPYSPVRRGLVFKKLRYGNGVQTEYRYREEGELSSLVTVTDQCRVLLNFGYAYDGNGNCTRKSGEQYRNEYAYDRMNRLEKASYDGKEERYTYDLAGNRLRKESCQGTENYHYNAKNQLTHIQDGTDTLRYLYDRQGNLLEEQGDAWKKRYGYDTTNRQTSIASAKTSDGAAEHVIQSSRYDGEGLRYETEENGKVIRFLFDGGRTGRRESGRRVYQLCKEIQSNLPVRK